MDGYHAGFAGMLRYLSREFHALADTTGEGERFAIYANVLEHIASDLMTADGPPVESQDKSDTLPRPAPLHVR